MTSLVCAADKPNFVIIMADDLGYGDISAGPFEGWIDTPNLDRLAKAGVSLTDFHSNGAVCSPTRAALMTGRYQQRAGIGGVVKADPRAGVHDDGLQPDVEVTFSKKLQAAGYATGMFGKWHLGYLPRYNPIHHGFDEFRGYVSGNVDYFSHVDQAGNFDWWIGDKLQQEEGYSTHLITQHTLDFIRKNKDKPFCVYVPHEAPHYPYQGPNDPPQRKVGQKAKHPRGPDDKQAYRLMVQEVDRGVGQIMDLVGELGIAGRTMIVFISDNGAIGLGSNRPLRGYKGRVWEGGHRVPAIVTWPDVVKPGTVNDATTLTMDLMPTMLEAAGLDQPTERALDGVSLMPVLRGGELGPRQLFWMYGKKTAMRDGPWKLVMNDLGAKEPALFDLSKDLSEKNDLSKDHPQRMKQMLEAIERWQQDMKDTQTPQP
ncbi:sulfatase-like hydrolase/transferase [Planctomycetales bacterium ZRK34]|nr:sulfatase-like hydrolase/transferase [Planctomycetales bacterium ZRK34]